LLMLLPFQNMGNPLLKAIFDHSIKKGLCHLSLISQGFFHLSDSSVDMIEEMDVAGELGIILDNGCEFIEVVKGFGESGVLGMNLGRGLDWFYLGLGNNLP